MSLLSVTTLLTTLLLLHLPLLPSSPIKDSRIFSFLLAESQHSSHTVEIVKASGKVAWCTFGYRTSGNRIVGEGSGREVGVEGGKKVPSFGELIEELGTMCLSTSNKIDSYWTYELCIKGKIKQFHGPDTYNMGVFEKLENNKLIYSNGQECVISGKPSIKRSTTIEFGCNKYTLTASIISIKEPSTCNYNVMVVSSSFCANPDFLVIDSVEQGQNIDIRDGHEDWFLQATESNNQVVCSVYTLEHQQSSSTLLSFESASLQSSETIESYRARRFARENCDDEFEGKSDGVYNKSTWDGKLSFLRITTKE